MCEGKVNPADVENQINFGARARAYGAHTRTHARTHARSHARTHVQERARAPTERWRASGKAGSGQVGSQAGEYDGV
eukprot:910036-Pleurochrysis_carterae.AAC.1